MLFSVVCCIFALSEMTVSGEMITTETYRHSATFGDGRLKVYWKFDDTHITIEVHGTTTGWVGIGFSPNGTMKGADIFIGWVKNGEVKVTDRHGIENTVPLLDPIQNIDILGGAECDGWTMFKFSRQLAACEAEYDREISQDTQRFIWALGSQDPKSNDIEPSHYHGTNRGVKRMYFLQSENLPLGLPPGPTYKSFEIRMDNFAVPAEDTYYNCKIFRLPTFTKKHHIVKTEPILQEGNERVIHHMLVFRCADKLEDPSELERDARCFSPDMKHFQTCTTIIGGFALGGGVTFYPHEAGYPIGDEGVPIYVMAQVHYDNPTLTKGIIDSSGTRFTYTDTLRQHDAGVVPIGADIIGTEHIVPPGVTDFLSIGHCTSDCWENRMSASGVQEIKIFSVLLHSHLAGRSMRVRQMRDGVELPIRAYDDHYDMEYQEPRFVDPRIIVKKRDHLQVECVYNTSNRTGVTVGGLGTRQEMCLAFLWYYPKIDLVECQSSVSKRDTWNFFGVDSDTAELIPGSHPKSLNSWRIPGVEGKTVLDYLNEFNWNQINSKDFEIYYNTLPHYEVCAPANKVKATNDKFIVSMETQRYIPSTKTCDEPNLPRSHKTAVFECRQHEDSSSVVTTAVVTTTSATTLLVAILVLACCN